MMEHYQNEETEYISEYITGDLLHGRTGAIISMYIKSGYDLVSVCGDNTFREMYFKKDLEKKDGDQE